MQNPRKVKTVISLKLKLSKMHYPSTHIFSMKPNNLNFSKWCYFILTSLRITIISYWFLKQRLFITNWHSDRMFEKFCCAKRLSNRISRIIAHVTHVKILVVAKIGIHIKIEKIVFVLKCIYLFYVTFHYLIKLFRDLMRPTNNKELLTSRAIFNGN